MAGSLVDKVSLSTGAISGNTNKEEASVSSRTRDVTGFIHVTALGAGTTLTAKIQHSKDGVLWFDLVSFSAISATGGQLVAATVACLPKARATFSFSGGTTTCTAEVELWYGVEE